MNKILIEVYFPLTSECYDIYIPLIISIGEVKGLITQIIEDLTSSVFFEKNQMYLCRFEDGEILDYKKTAFELGLKNGDKLLLL